MYYIWEGPFILCELEIAGERERERERERDPSDRSSSLANYLMSDSIIVTGGPNLGRPWEHRQSLMRMYMPP
jgi:hypothetical protein